MADALTISRPVLQPLNTRSLAEKLARCARRGETATLGPNERPETLTEAEAVQDAMIALLDPAVAAWKIGASSHAARASLGFKRNFSAPLGDEAVFSAPCHVPLDPARAWGVECEIALIPARTYPPHDRPDAERLIADGLAAAPAFEWPQTRFATLGGEGPEALVADNGAAGMAVIGAPVAISGDEFADLLVRLFINGEEVATGDASALIGAPIALLADHIVRIGERGYALAAGKPVLTGSVTPFTSVRPGESVAADFGRLGRIEVTTG